MHITIDGHFFKVTDNEKNEVFGTFKEGKSIIISANYFGYEYSINFGIWKRYGRLPATKIFNAWIEHMEEQAEKLINDLKKVVQ